MLFGPVWTAGLGRAGLGRARLARRARAAGPGRGLPAGLGRPFLGLGAQRRGRLGADQAVNLEALLFLVVADRGRGQRTELAVDVQVVAELVEPGLEIADPLPGLALTDRVLVPRGSGRAAARAGAELAARAAGVQGLEGGIGGHVHRGAGAQRGGVPGPFPLGVLRRVLAGGPLFQQVAVAVSLVFGEVAVLHQQPDAPHVVAAGAPPDLGAALAGGPVFAQPLGVAGVRRRGLRGPDLHGRARGGRGDVAAEVQGQGEVLGLLPGGVAGDLAVRAGHAERLVRRAVRVIRLDQRHRGAGVLDPLGEVAGAAAAVPLERLGRGVVLDPQAEPGLGGGALRDLAQLAGEIAEPGHRLRAEPFPLRRVQRGGHVDLGRGHLPHADLAGDVAQRGGGLGLAPAARGPGRVDLVGQGADGPDVLEGAGAGVPAAAAEVEAFEPAAAGTAPVDARVQLFTPGGLGERLDGGGPLGRALRACGPPGSSRTWRGRCGSARCVPPGRSGCAAGCAGTRRRGW